MKSTPEAPKKKTSPTLLFRERLLRQAGFTGRDILNSERDSVEVQFSALYQTLKHIVKSEREQERQLHNIAESKNRQLQILEDANTELWFLTGASNRVGRTLFELRSQKKHLETRLNILSQSHQALSQNLGSPRAPLYKHTFTESPSPIFSEPRRHGNCRHRSPIGSPISTLKLGNNVPSALFSWGQHVSEKPLGPEVLEGICSGGGTSASQTGMTPLSI